MRFRPEISESLKTKRRACVIYLWRSIEVVYSGSFFATTAVTLLTPTVTTVQLKPVVIPVHSFVLLLFA